MLIRLSKNAAMFTFDLLQGIRELKTITVKERMA
jgi:hypothetical protein